MSLNRKLAELRAKQAAQRTRAMMFSGLEVSELKAIRDLAIATWGSRADIHVPPEKPGVLHVGFFLDDHTHLPPQRRKALTVATGRSHREIAEQIRLWKMNQ